MLNLFDEGAEGRAFGHFAFFAINLDLHRVAF